VSPHSQTPGAARVQRPSGRELTQRVKETAAKPENRAKIEKLRARLAHQPSGAVKHEPSIDRRTRLRARLMAYRAGSANSRHPLGRRATPAGRSCQWLNTRKLSAPQAAFRTGQ